MFFVFAGLFYAFDENRDNHIDFKEMACGISACCRGPMVERQKCEYNAYNIGGRIETPGTLSLYIFLVLLRSQLKTAIWV